MTMKIEAYTPVKGRWVAINDDGWDYSAFIKEGEPSPIESYSEGKPTIGPGEKICDVEGVEDARQKLFGKTAVFVVNGWKVLHGIKELEEYVNGVK